MAPSAILDGIETAARRIPDRTLASEYRRVLLDRFFAGRNTRQRSSAKQVIARPSPTSDTVTTERLRILTAILLRHPIILRDVEQACAGLELPPPLALLHNCIQEWSEITEILDSQALISHLTASGLHAEVDQVLAMAPVPLPACASSTAMPAEAEAGWWHIFGFLNVQRLGEEIALAEAAFRQDMTPQNQNRLIALKTALNKINSGEPDGVDLAA